MPELIAPYTAVVTAYAALCVLLLAQALVADFAGIRAGHVPGTAIVGGHDDFLFRATRAQANTNENLGFFILASLTAMFAGASPRWCGLLAWGFVASRLVHMVAYYADLRPLRSTAFSIGLLCVIALLVLALVALF